MTIDAPAVAVHVVTADNEVVVARVRHDDGIFDVTRGRLTGWSCSCGEDYGCCHVLAVGESIEARK